MWITLLAMAVAVSLEPFRIGMTVLMINRPRPLLQLLAFLTGGFAMGTTVGVIVLFILPPALGSAHFTLPRVQIVVGAVLGGLLDDRVGSKLVIAGSLTAMIVVGLVLLTVSGPLAFWTCGLLLCSFVGPTLASARALMMRMSAEGKEGVAFGLYTTTGRAVSFLAPWMFFTFVDLFDSDRAGLAGLCLVLAAGLAAMMITVRVPREAH